VRRCVPVAGVPQRSGSACWRWREERRWWSVRSRASWDRRAAPLPARVPRQLAQRRASLGPSLRANDATMSHMRHVAARARARAATATRASRLAGGETAAPQGEEVALQLGGAISACARRRFLGLSTNRRRRPRGRPDHPRDRTARQGPFTASTCCVRSRRRALRSGPRPVRRGAVASAALPPAGDSRRSRRLQRGHARGVGVPSGRTGCPTDGCLSSRRARAYCWAASLTVRWRRMVICVAPLIRTPVTGWSSTVAATPMSEVRRLSRARRATGCR
jgi:hypothetical protein